MDGLIEKHVLRGKMRDISLAQKFEMSILQGKNVKFGGKRKKISGCRVLKPNEEDEGDLTSCL